MRAFPLSLQILRFEKIRRDRKQVHEGCTKFDTLYAQRHGAIQPNLHPGIHLQIYKDIKIKIYITIHQTPHPNTATPEFNDIYV